MDTIRDITTNAGQFETGGLFLGEKSIIDGVYTITIKRATGPGQKNLVNTILFQIKTIIKSKCAMNYT